MSNESSLAENVVLEIAEVTGTEDVSSYGIVGYDITYEVTGCVERPLSYEQAFNSLGANGFEPTPGICGELKVRYKGDSFAFSVSGAIGELSQGCPYTDTPLGCVSSWYRYDPAGTNFKLFIIRLIDSASESWVTPLEFWGSCSYTQTQNGSLPYYLFPTYNNNLYNPPNNNRNYVPMNQQQMSFNVQGRCLYMKERGTSKTYCFDVFDSHTTNNPAGTTSLVVMGNGTDDVIDLQNTFPDFWNNNGEDYDWYVSAYVHSGLWDSRDSQFTWDNRRESEPISYMGKRNTPGYVTNDCFENTGYLGLRSSCFEHGYGSYGPEGYDGWELEIEVASLNNATISILEGTPDDVTIGVLNPPAITTTGVHTFCLGALKRAEKWSGYGNGSGGLWGRLPIDVGAGDKLDAFAGSVSLLNAEAIDPASPASVTIDCIRLHRKEVESTETRTPIQGVIAQFTIDDLAWDYLDVLESSGVPLSLNFSVGDLRDIGKRTSGYSKTFKIPASPHNNEVLDPMLSVGSERKNIYWKKARIQSNGVYVFKGLMRVEQGHTGEGGYYNCHIIQDTIDWSQALGDSKLCDLVLGEDPPKVKSYQNIVDSWSHNPDYDNYFWGLVNYGEWYAESVNTGSSPDWSKSSKDFHPLIFAKSLVYKIFDSIGYTLISDFVESPVFEKLCHPFASGQDYFDTDLFGAAGDGGGSQFAHVVRLPKTTSGGNWNGGGEIPANGYTRTEYPDLQPGSDVGNNWSNNYSGSSHTSPGNGYTAPFTGDYYIYAKATMYISQNDIANIGGNGGRMWFDIMKNGSCIYEGYSIPTLSGNNSVMHLNPTGAWGGTTVKMDTSGASGGVVIDLAFQTQLSTGDHITFRFRGKNTNNIYKCWTKYSDTVLDIYPIPSNIVPDFEVNFGKVLPCDKQIDYLGGLTEMFNLQWTADEEKKTVYVEPYNDFFGSGKVLDWTEKLDYTTWGDKFIIEELAKSVMFRYNKDTGDELVKKLYDHREEIGSPEYKSHTELNDEKFRKDEVIMGTKYFHSTVQFEGYGTAANPSLWGSGYAWGDQTFNNPNNKKNPVMTAMWKGDVDRWEWYIWGGGCRPTNVDIPGPFKMRILNYYGDVPCKSWIFKDSGGASHAQHTYPFAGFRDTWLDGLAEDPYCLSWRDWDENGFKSPGLFSKYWYAAYQKMNGGAALRTCWMNLNPVDIATFDYRDLIHLTIDGVSTYWTINKIIDYKPNQNVLTKVELIEWKHALDFSREAEQGEPQSKLTDGGTEPPGRAGGGIRRTENGGLLLVENTENNRNRSQGTGIAIGPGANAQNNQTVFGRFNLQNSNDIFQVGSGESQINRTTAFAITEDGDVQVQGGEIIVEDSNGNPHSLVYKEADGGKYTEKDKNSMRKLYLKKEE